MEASQVTISKSTMEKQEKIMQQFAQERCDKAVAYIRNKPAGTALSHRDIAHAAGLKKGSSTQFVHELISRGLVRRVPVPGRYNSYSWTVLADVQPVGHIVTNALGLNKKERSTTWEYRLALALEFIRQKGPLVRINKQAIGNVAGVPKTAANYFCDQLVAKGYVTMETEEGHPQSYHWTVVEKEEPASITPEVTAEVETPTPVTVPEPVVAAPVTVVPTNEQIVAVAKQFAWDENTDSLRAFIKHLEQQ